MSELRDAIVELYTEAATSLPSDIEDALRKAYRVERKGSAARTALSVILGNVERAREKGRPLCQDTGVPFFFIRAPAGLSHLSLKKAVLAATRIATKKVPLRANAVDIHTDKNSGDNTGIGFPVIYSEETKGTRLVIDLMLKGSGSENTGQLYRLPMEELDAERDLEGVRRCVLDAVLKAQGKGCPPYVVGVGIGATKDQVTRLSKEQLLRSLSERNSSDVLAKWERRILTDVNRLGIGPLGFGGLTTAMGVKIGVNHRHPASFFVDVSLSCWADRRARLECRLKGPDKRLKDVRCTIQ